MTPDPLRFAEASPEDAAELSALHTAVADDLTARFGTGHWSLRTSERGVIAGLKHAKVVTARRGGRVVGTLRLATKKPWAIDVSYFRPVPRPLYLTGMAVLPELQRSGVGRRLIERAIDVTRAWPAQAIRLDAYDADAGGGGFYAKCGFDEVGRVVYKGNPLIYYEMVIA